MKKTHVSKEVFTMALDNVRAHKFRSFLTVLGIVIGVATVIGIASILTGLRANLIQYVEDFGINNIYAFHLSTGMQLGGRDRSERTRKPLTDEDADAIRNYAPAVEAVSSQLFLWLQGEQRTLTNGDVKYKQGQITGVSANYASVT
ncbi:MAG TPA: ABC transporter permease, partial [Blastocatellia bacterium]|nr:ABC transporter permease [Blastocatellia bacterium]